MEAISGVFGVYNSIVADINSGKIKLERGNICPICLDCGFKVESRVNYWGTAYWGVSKSENCCSYWDRRAAQITEHKKIER